MLSRNLSSPPKPLVPSSEFYYRDFSLLEQPESLEFRGGLNVFFLSAGEEAEE